MTPEETELKAALVEGGFESPPAHRFTRTDPRGPEYGTYVAFVVAEPRSSRVVTDMRKDAANRIPGPTVELITGWADRLVRVYEKPYIQVIKKDGCGTVKWRVRFLRAQDFREFAQDLL